MTPAKRAPDATSALRDSLVEHGRQLVSRDGPSALTMRALAAEAGCATGLPYKVFADRGELVAEIVRAEFRHLHDAAAELVERAGTKTVAANLAWFAEAILDSTAVALAPEIVRDPALSTRFTADAHTTGLGPALFERAFADYLTGEQRAGRVAADVDAAAFAFVLAGAIHNLVMSGDAWPRPSRRVLQRRLGAIAAAIAPRR